MRYLNPIVLMLSLILSQSAAAHTDKYLETVAAPHGGQLRAAGMYHCELMIQEKDITVYVTDHAYNKLDTKGASGTVTVLSGKTKAEISLHPAGDNIMKGTGEFTLAPGAEIMLSITMPGKAAQRTRFKYINTLK